MTTTKKKITPEYVTGIAYYPSLTQPNELSGKYQVTIGQLDDTTVKMLQSKGLKVNVDNAAQREAEGKVYRGCWITPKQQADRTPPTVVDSKNKRFDASKLGTGSKIVAAVNIYDTTYGAKAVGLMKVGIIDLVEYNGSGSWDDLDMGIEDGFVAEESVDFTDDTNDAPFDV
jgi:hypothetical protein